MRGRDEFRRIRRILHGCSAVHRLLPVFWNRFLLDLHRSTRGRLGIAVRFILLKAVALRVGDNVCIYPDVYLLHPEKLDIGNNVSIHPMCYIDASGGIVIGNNVSIAHGATVMSSSHIYMNPDIPMKDQGIEMRMTTIGNDVWIGAKATVLYGRCIADGSIVAANSVISKDTKPFSLSGGVPAKPIGMRCNDKRPVSDESDLETE